MYIKYLCILGPGGRRVLIIMNFLEQHHCDIIFVIYAV
jgi:hypothetical protein